MPRVVGIQFKGVGRIYYFDPLDFEFEPGEYAIVETVRGLEIGKVILGNHDLENGKLETELKPVIRKGTIEDVKQEEYNDKLAQDAIKVFKNCGKSRQNKTTAHHLYSPQNFLYGRFLP